MAAPIKFKISNLKFQIGLKGFTLIELMVAIAIVAVIAAVGMVMYSSAQKAGRISKRLQDLQAIQNGLEIYKSAVGNYPPAVTSAGTYACIGAASGGLTALVPNYMPSLPADPLDGGSTTGTNCYEYTSNSTTAASSTEYKIRTKTSIATSAEMTSAAFAQQSNFLDPARDGTVDCVVQTGAVTYQGWAIYNGGTTTCAY